jgi:hypothetical protein
MTLEPVWDKLYPAKQARILPLLIERLDLSPDSISVTLHAAGIRSLITELAAEQAEASELGDGAMLEQPSNDKAGQPRGRDVDHPHPDAASAPGVAES